MEIQLLPLFCLNCLLAFSFAASMLFIAYGIADQFLGNDEISVKWCGTIVIGLWIASVGFHLLVAFGMLRLWIVILVIICLVSIRRLSHYSFTAPFFSVRNDWLKFKNFALSEITSPLQRCFLAILGIGALLVAARCCVLPPLAWDTLTYHAVKAGIWVQNGHIGLIEAPGGWSCFRNYPGGGEALQALSMLPFHSDFLICLVDFVEWIALIPTIFLLGKSIGLNSKSSLIGSVFCLFLPCVVFSVGSCYVDILFALALMLSMVFALRFFLYEDLRYLVLGLMSLGVAGGVKYFAYAPICVTLVVIISRTVLRHQFGIKTAMVFWLALILMLSPMIPWIVYNIPTEGDGFFPIPLGQLGLKLGPNPQALWCMDSPGTMSYDMKQEALAFIRLFKWPWHAPHGWKSPNFGILSLLPLCVFPMAIIFIARRKIWLCFLIVAVTGSLVASYLLPGFTVIRQSSDNNSRYLLGFMFPVIVTSILVFRETFRERYLDYLLLGSVVNLIIGVRLDWQLFEVPYLVLASVLVALGLFCFFFGRQPTLAHYCSRVFIALVFCCGLYLARHHVRPEAIAKSYFLHGFPRYWVEAAAQTDNRSFKRSIAVTSGENQWFGNWFMYIFLGESLQNKLYHVPATENGKLQHWGPWTGMPNYRYESWRSHLYELGITEVISFAPKSIEMYWMLEHPESFEEVTGGHDFGLFRVR